MSISVQVINSRSVECWRSPDDAMDLITLFYQKFRKVGAILSCNTSYQSTLSTTCPILINFHPFRSRTFWHRICEHQSGQVASDPSSLPVPLQSLAIGDCNCQSSTSSNAPSSQNIEDISTTEIIPGWIFSKMGWKCTNINRTCRSVAQTFSELWAVSCLWSLWAVQRLDSHLTGA